jgi:magnesium transporter
VAFRGSGDRLADRMDSDPRSVSSQEILTLKREALALGRVVDEELAVLEALKVCNQPALPMHHLASTLQTAIEIARATDRDVDRLGRRIGDLQLRYELAQRELTNRRLGFLAVISAIFMPLTLITGIYGMNFDLMPELHYRYSYPIALGTMALIAAVLFWYFRSRWWPK